MDFSLVLGAKLLSNRQVWTKRGRKKLDDKSLFYYSDGTPLPKEAFDIKKTVDIEVHFFSFDRQLLIPIMLEIRQIIKDCCPSIKERIGEKFITYGIGSRFFILSTNKRHIWLDVRRGSSFELPKWEHWRIDSAFNLKRLRGIIS